MTSPTAAARPRGVVVVAVFALVMALAIVAAECTPDDPNTESTRPAGSSTGSGSEKAESTSGAKATTTTALPELPSGGRTIFPGHRVVGFYGNSETAALGVLGETDPEGAVDRVNAAAAPFATPDRPVLGAFELIVTVAQRDAGPSGNYTEAASMDSIERWIDVAEENGLLVVLDLQPGRASFVDQVKMFEKFLRRPHVGLGLDPEWRMKPDQVPGKAIGEVQASEVNEVGTYLSNIVTENDLPQKLFVIHQFTTDMIVNREALETEYEGLATVIHIDGFGTQKVKTEKYDELAVQPPLYNGFKLFYDEDTDIFEPAEALALDPSPDLFTYQ